jgi:hypothetical protein
MTTRAVEPGGQWGHVPPPLHFFKSKKVPFFGAFSAPSKERMNALFRWKDSALFAVVKTQERPFPTLSRLHTCIFKNFRSARERHKIV